MNILKNLGKLNSKFFLQIIQFYRGGVKKKINLEREKSTPIYSNIPPSKGNHNYDCAQVW